MITRITPLSRLTLLTVTLCLNGGHALAAGKDMAPRPTAPSVRSRANPADTCGQQAAQRLFGTVFTPQSRIALSKAIGHDRIRVIRPGSVIAHDLRGDRLNLIIDESGHLLTARCG